MATVRYLFLRPYLEAAKGGASHTHYLFLSLHLESPEIMKREQNGATELDMIFPKETSSFLCLSGKVSIFVRSLGRVCAKQIQPNRLANFAIRPHFTNKEQKTQRLNNVPSSTYMVSERAKI